MIKASDEIINENKVTLSKTMDLSNCGLNEIPASVFDCTWLEELILSNEWVDVINSQPVSSINVGEKNKLLTIPIAIVKLQNLKSLRISGSPSNRWEIENIELLGQLKKLEHLDLSFNCIENVSNLGNLQALKTLNLRNNQIISVKDLYNLTSLEELKLKGNKIKDPQYLSNLVKMRKLSINVHSSVHDYSFLKNYREIVSLDLSNNNFKSFGFVGQLKTLEELYLFDNSIFDLSGIEGLTSLKILNLRKNFIKNIKPLKSLIQLEKLDLEGNQIINTDDLGELTSLQVLNLRDNHISDLSLTMLNGLELEIDIHEIKHLNEKRIYLAKNFIRNVPDEILEQGRIFSIQHLKSKNNRPLNECKVIITGRGKVGKTSLQKRLFGDEEFDWNESETHGIRKRSWTGEVLSFQKDPIKVNFWDMGGQQNQQTLHQLFYTENTLYILLLDRRADEDPEDFLELIKAYANNSDVIVVINFIKPHSKDEFKYNLYPDFDSTLRLKYGNIKKTFGVCCALENDEGISNLKKYLKEHIPTLQYVRKEYSANWIEIKDELLNRVDKNYIKYEEYARLCIRKNVTIEQIQFGLAKMLNNTGAITLFEKKFLGNYYILNPDWVTTGAYEIMLSPVAARNAGFIKHGDLKEIFYKKLSFKYEEEDYEFLMKLMTEYELCHENVETKEWLIPASLKAQSDMDLVKFKEEGCRLYCLKYKNSLPQSIIHRFIVRNIDYAYKNDYWRNGIVLVHPRSNTLLFVEADFKDKVVRLWIKGKDILEAWKFFRKDFIDLSKKFPYDELVEIWGEKSHMMSYFELVNLHKRLPPDKLTHWYNPSLDIRVNVIKSLGLFDDLTEIFRKENLDDIYQPYIDHEKQEKEDLKSKLERIRENVEDRIVRKWKRKPIPIICLSLLITLFCVVCYIYEYQFLFPEQTWAVIKKSSWISVVCFAVATVWNGFFIKIVYDRFLDPSKEKAFRESKEFKRLTKL